MHEAGELGSVHLFVCGHLFIFLVLLEEELKSEFQLFVSLFDLSALDCTRPARQNMEERLAAEETRYFPEELLEMNLFSFFGLGPEAVCGAPCTKAQSLTVSVKVNRQIKAIKFNSNYKTVWMSSAEIPE